jgi:hypothetical protein
MALPSPTAPMAAGPILPTMTTSTTVMVIQPISDNATGIASVSSARSSAARFTRPWCWSKISVWELGAAGGCIADR